MDAFYTGSLPETVDVDYTLIGMGGAAEELSRREHTFARKLYQVAAYRAAVDPKAIPIAESARVQRIPPWTVPIGLWCLRPASIWKRASPAPYDSIRKPTRSAAGGWISPPARSVSENDAPFTSSAR